MVDETWGINSDYGFYRPNLAEVIEEVQEDLVDYFGDVLNIGDNSRAGMLAKVQAGREFKVWQQLEAVYDSQTKDGAEGEFMDEMYGYQGVTRNSSSSGSGTVTVETDSTMEDIETDDEGTIFSATNGIQYESETTRTLSEYVTAYKIVDSDLTAGSYTFTVINNDTTETTDTFTLASNDDADRITFFNELLTFFETALPDETGTMYVDETTDETAFYVGFGYTEDTGYYVDGTSEVFTLTFGTDRIGNRYSNISVVATTAGYYALNAGNITSMVPVPTGYQSVTNLDSFFSGSDTETDAAFSVRAESQSDAPNSGTRPAILAELNAIDDVSGADLIKTVDLSNGTVTVEPIIFGGDSEDIATVLYETQPINNQYIGDITYTVTTEDGSTEDIKFTRGTDLNISVRLQYTPLNGISLTDDEITDIEDSIEDVNSNLSAGSTVFIGQVSGAVFDTNPSRFSALTVEIKLETEDDSEYASEDYVPASSELANLSSDRVEIIRIS